MSRSVSGGRLRYILAICHFVTSGCIPFFTGPSEGEVSSIKPSPVTAGNVPLLIEIERTQVKTVSGRVLIGDSELNSRPLQYVLLELTDGKAVLAGASTDGLGKFEISEKLSTGEYWVRLNSNHYAGQIRVKLKQAVTTDIIIRAERKISSLSSDEETTSPSKNRLNLCRLLLRKSNSLAQKFRLQFP